MPQPTLNDLTAFLAVAEHRSFRRAADALGLSPSSLSHTLRALEQDLGVRLLNRTTRSVAPTEAGQRLVEQLRPVLTELDRALGAVDAFRGTPSGTVRINAPRTGARLLLGRVAPVFLARFPDVTLDIVAEGRLVDIVAQGFDAGVRLGEALPQDMVRVPLGGEGRFVPVASPAYLARAGTPRTPDDLRLHACVRIRLPSGRLYLWEFERHGQEMAVDVPGPLILDDMELMIEAAAAGLGIAYVFERTAGPELDAGRLVTVLDEWCPYIPGICLYYPERRQMPPALRAFIDTAREILS
ncbi:LysR family transcriptional regulator [Arenibaculum pallidiluteum]|uniref:LysR family transcriptional regulator n=1 Tax=Arenibaculum pallidiluteum TaxID=2812559 RepID=UPI001A95AB00|nr:LysR family transcriptional regulator [Arenibaculum pallidiluteum]